MSMYDKTHYSIVISLQLIKISETQKKKKEKKGTCFKQPRTEDTHKELQIHLAKLRIFSAHISIS